MKKTISLIFMLIVHTVNAQSLSLNECINRALKTHPDIKKFTLQVKNNKRAIDIARSEYLPQITLNAEYNPTRTYTLPANGVFNTKDDDGWLVGGAINQKIWDFSKTSLTIQAQKIQKDISNLTLDDAKALLAYKVKLQYELMLVQREAIKVRQKDLEAKEELYKQAQAFVLQGMKTDIDSGRFLSSVYVAKDNLAIAQASFDKARAILSLYIDKKIEEDVKLEDAISDSSWHTRIVNNLIEESPLLKSLKKNIERNEYNYKATKALHYGSIDAIASYTHQNTLNEYDSSLVGVTLKIPLYSGGKTTALVEQARINEQSATAEYNSKELDYKEELKSLVIDLRRYEKTIDAKKSLLEVSQKTKILITGRYKEGLSTYTEVLDAATLTLEAELGVLQAEYERSSTIHRLEYLQGKTL